LQPRWLAACKSARDAPALKAEFIAAIIRAYRKVDCKRTRQTSFTIRALFRMRGIARKCWIFGPCGEAE
jgi:hypothetical protein